MKLVCALFVTLGKCYTSSSDDYWGKVPQGHKGIPTTQCVNGVEWFIHKWNRSTQIITNIDNGEHGTVTVDFYQPDEHCYLEIGSKCDSDGVEVEFTFMSIENTWVYDSNVPLDDNIDYYQYTGCYDTVHFAYMSNGSQVETEGQCGCLNRDHPSCDYEALFDADFYGDLFQNSPTDKPSKHELIGTDIKLILTSDSSHSGRFHVDWKCRTSHANSPSNTIEMAEALLTGPFTPLMAADYGCAGRGFFDPFAPTIGSHTDEIDGFFFAWKKCVQCATGNDKAAILPYSYNSNNDTCGTFFISL